MSKSTQVVPKGYKQTEVGVIPTDWKICRVSELVQSGPKNGYSGRSGWNAKGTATLSLSATTSGRLILSAETVKHLETTISPDSDLFLRPNDVLVQRSNTIDLVGTTAIFDGSERTYIYPDLMMRLRFPSSTLAQWFWRYSNSRSGRSYFTRVAAGSTGSMPKLSGDKLRDMLIPLPPTLAEQEAIASALSDADGLIESLEKLIAKKRQIKHGTMQELLTGQRRLPGFTGEWGSKQLGDLGRWTGGMTPSMRNPDYWKLGTIPWISSGDVKTVRLTTTGVSITEFAVKQRTTTLLPTHSIVVVTRSGILRKYLPVAINMVPMAINQDIKALLPGSGIEPEYVLHALTSNGERILASCLKSGTTVESIEFRWLKAFTIPFPSTPAEQTAIATILSDMDAEIAALEAKLAKARQVKQGMMQELLTGKVRLV